MDPFWTKIAETHLEGEFAYEIDSKFGKSAGPAAGNLERLIEMDRKPLPAEGILQKMTKIRTDGRTKKPRIRIRPPLHTHTQEQNMRRSGRGRPPRLTSIIIISWMLKNALEPMLS